MLHSVLTENIIVIAIILILVLLLIPIIFKRMIEGRLLKYFARRQSTNGRIVVRQLSQLLWFFTIIGSLWILTYFFSTEIPDNVESILVQVNRILIAIAIVWFINRIIQESIGFYTKRGKLPSTTIFTNLTRIAIFALLVTSIMYSLGLSIAPLLATIGVGGLAIALALQDTLSSLFAGIYIILSKQINPGDYVRLSSSEEGFIQDINWRNTTIRTRENNMIIVPNRSISNLIIINFSLLSKEMSLVIPVGIHYETDLELAESLAIQVGKEVLTEIPGGVPDFIPLVRYNAFADSAITFNVILRIQEYTSQGMIRHNFIKKLRVKYKEYGITIPYPMRTLTFEQNLGVQRIELETPNS